MQERVAAIEARLSALPGEVDAAKRLTITEQRVRSTLEAFGPVWEALWPTERVRILGLLAERIAYDGRDGSIAVRLRPDGIGAAATGGTA